MTEWLHVYAAPYSAATRRSAGGGLADAKTIMLLLLQWSVLRGPFSELDRRSAQG